MDSFSVFTAQLHVTIACQPFDQDAPYVVQIASADQKTRGSSVIDRAVAIESLHNRHRRVAGLKQITPHTSALPNLQ
jgi:hypothetical protein